MSSTPTPTDAIATYTQELHDLIGKWIDMNNRGMTNNLSLPIKDDWVPIMYAKIAALESELAALRKDVATVRESDIDCACQVLDDCVQYAHAVYEQDAAKIIAAHVASRLAPVQAELDEAVGLLKRCQANIAHETALAGRFEEPEIIRAVTAFLTHHQRDNAQGEG